MRSISIFFLGFVFYSNLVYGATIYVDNLKAGDCSGIGTGYNVSSTLCNDGDETKYDTIQEAINASSSGDTIKIRAGTYRGALTISGKGTLTIQNYTPYGTDVVIKFPSDWTAGSTEGLVNLGDGQNITFEDLEFDGERSTLANTTNEYCCTNGSKHIGFYEGGAITIRRTKIHDFACGTINNNTGDFIVEDTEIYSIGEPYGSGVCTAYGRPEANKYDHGLYHDGGNNEIYEVTRSYIHDIAASGIKVSYGDGSTSLTMTYTIIEGYGKSGTSVGTGIWTGNSGSANGADFYIYGCVIDGDGTGSIGINMNDEDTYVIKNTIFMDNATSHLYAGNAHLGYETGGSVEYNIYSGGTICGNCGADPNNISQTFDDVPPNITTSPTFVVLNPSTWSEYAPVASGSQVNAGTDLGAFYQNALDPNDTEWPASTVNQNWFPTWEIGPFVLRDRPAPPQNLKIK